MKIGIDARMYGTGTGGIGRYIQKLIENLEKIDQQNEYVIFLRQENWSEYIPTASNFRKVLADIRWYGWREQILLPRILKREKLDLLHFPHWNVPIFYHGRFVVTIHDLLLRRYPTKEASTLGPISYFFKNLAYRFVSAYAARHAEKIFTVSQASARDIENYFHASKEKIQVTYLAHSMEAGISKEAARQYVGDKFGLGGEFGIYVGVAFPHKNLERLIRIWPKVVEKIPQATLVLAGKENYFYKKIKQIIAAEGLNRIIYINFPTDEDIRHLLSAARLFIMPSLFEGFGMPPLDALACGVPVVSSNTTSLPEVLGESALYFNPEDENDMLDKIVRGWTDENVRFEILRNAPAELSKFSYEKMAEDTLSSYFSKKR